MIILLHSSKTMRPLPAGQNMSRPALLDRAVRLDSYLKNLTIEQLAKTMHLSGPLAEKTHKLVEAWSTSPKQQSLALDCFVGDIYKGLLARELSAADRDYADQTLRILSGLYGLIRPFDGICPYRLEMGYVLPGPEIGNLYAYWAQAIADCLPTKGLIVNLASLEYACAVTPFIDPERIVAPNFLTRSPSTQEPTFVVVHSKIARGAFARWLIASRVQDAASLSQFADLGYHFDAKLSTPAQPTFVCQTFEGTTMGITRQIPT